MNKELDFIDGGGGEHDRTDKGSQLIFDVTKENKIKDEENIMHRREEATRTNLSRRSSKTILRNVIFTFRNSVSSIT